MHPHQLKRLIASSTLQLTTIDLIVGRFEFDEQVLDVNLEIPVFLRYKRNMKDLIGG